MREDLITISKTELEELILSFRKRFEFFTSAIHDTIEKEFRALLEKSGIEQPPGAGNTDSTGGIDTIQ